MWSWKSKSSKKCVTTYLPNESALKIDGAIVNSFSHAIVLGCDIKNNEYEGVTVALKLYLVIKSGASVSADLGSSSSYSNEIEFTLSIWHSKELILW